MGSMNNEIKKLLGLEHRIVTLVSKFDHFFFRQGRFFGVTVRRESCPQVGCFWVVKLTRLSLALRMTLVDIVDLSSDDEPEEVVVKAVKLEADLVGRALQLKNCSKVELVKHQMLKTKSSIQGNEENGSVKSLKADHNITNQGQSSANDTSTLSRSQAPICRQFWKAGNYNDGLGSKVTPQNGKNYLQVHPMFLHSNATSHKWAFGAIAELLDNAIDEIQNGATFVVVDEISNPRDGNPALLIQDDGGGMDPIAMRGCLSFGFSEKSKSSIGRYGNGFKTSTMRLGADVIVFSRHLDKSYSPMISYCLLAKFGTQEKWFVSIGIRALVANLRLTNGVEVESVTSLAGRVTQMLKQVKE